ncbi:MAG TPA: serine/threonine-protein kinase [Labilithrix sp.]
MAGDTDEKPLAEVQTAHESGSAGKRPQTIRPRPGGPRALVGLTIGDRYRVEELIGEGGMGAVYRVQHTQLRKAMAVKVLHPEMTRLPEVVQRFENEAMAAAHIDHPHVVAATDFGKLDDGSFFLALEFVEGKTLREVIGEGRLELGRALHISTQIAAALSRAHSLKIVHRDLKPENVKLTLRNDDPDFVKVLDFGIAKVSLGELIDGEPTDPKRPVLTQAGMVYGTPEYMAPEQALGQPVDARADLYALGIITYEMLTGLRPFEAESKVALLGMQVTAPVPKMADKCAEANVPPEVEQLVISLLAKEASARIADAKIVVDKLGVVMTQLASQGLIDPAYAPSPGSLTNPGIISAISPAPPELAGQAPRSQKDSARHPPGNLPTPAPSAGGPLAGKAWLIAAAAGLVFLGIITSISLYILHARTTGEESADAAVVATEDAAVTKPPSPLDQRIKEGIAMIDRGDYASGTKELEALLPEVEEPREDIHRALFTAYASTEQPEKALREAKAWLKANPSLDVTKEEKLRVEVRNDALKEGTIASEAFGILENQMGTIGWDDVYDIGYGAPSVAYPKAADRAKHEILRGDRKKMSEALAVTADLQAAGATCNAKQYFDRAADKGDERTLFVLRPLVAPRIAGHFRRFDLLGCIHDGSLAKTIQTIEDRVKTQKKK